MFLGGRNGARASKLENRSAPSRDRPPSKETYGGLRVETEEERGGDWKEGMRMGCDSTSLEGSIRFHLD